MNKLTINSILIAICLAFSASAMAQTMSNGRSAAEASGKEEVVRPEMNTKFQPSEGAIYQVRIAEADADYSEARKKCDDKAGNVKNACVKEARATAAITKGDAKVRMRTANASKKAAKSGSKMP